MFRRVLLAAVLSGIAAALVMSAIQHVRVTPLILEAETYEVGHAAAMAAGTAEPAAAHSHDHGSADGHAHADGADHGHDHAASAGGIQRTALTVTANVLTGVSFALVLAAAALLLGLPLTPANGALWGLMGFLTFSLAPAAGLPPELPGMPAADLAARQLWWAGTVISTGAAIVLLAKKRELTAAVLAVVLVALPHIFGAPAPITHESNVPPHLAAAFAANALATAAIFWLLIGLFLGKALNFTAKD